MSEQSNTPRTDSQACGKDRNGEQWVNSAFARQLETELTELKATCEGLRKEIQFRVEEKAKSKSVYTAADAGQIIAIKSERDSLKQQNDEAKKDSKRLDWLEEDSFNMWTSEDELGEVVCLDTDKNTHFVDRHIRQAIDAAMGKEK